MNAVLPLLCYNNLVLLGTLVGLLVLVGLLRVVKNNFTVTAKRACVSL